MSGLSSRVMNMKFMQKDGSEKTEEVTKKVIDSSEWKLPNATAIISRAKVGNTIETVGYSSINSFASDSVPTRRTWGAPAKEEVVEEAAGLDVLKLKDAVDKKSKRKNSSDRPEKVEKSKDFLRNLWDRKLSIDESKEESENIPSEKKRSGDYIPNIKNKQKRLQK